MLRWGCQLRADGERKTFPKWQNIYSSNRKRFFPIVVWFYFIQFLRQASKKTKIKSLLSFIFPRRKKIVYDKRKNHLSFALRDDLYLYEYCCWAKQNNEWQG
jgi:hypothetical protein